MDMDILTKALSDRDEAILAKLATIEGKATDSADTGNVLTARLDEIEQKMARRGSGDFGPAAAPSWGDQFSEAEEVKAFAHETSRPGRVRIQMKTTLTSASGSGGDLIAPQRDNLVGMPQRRMTIRDLMPVIKVTSNTVEFPRQTARTNNAAPVAEAALKPESAYTFELVTTPIRTIAHWIPASRQVMDDAPQLKGLIDTELRYGLALLEEAQLLNGDGTGQNLGGLIPAATAFSAPFDITNPTMIDTIGLAVLQSALAEQPANGIVMHPADWMQIRLTKDADGKYILGDPGANVPPVLFGLPVVATQAMTVDKFLVGNFQTAGTIYDRWEARVEVSTEHADFFVRNLIAILAEERLGLGIKQPLALTYGDFGNVA